MKKLATGIMTAVLMAGLSVCGAEPGNAMLPLSAVCRDGVCEIAPANPAGTKAVALEAGTRARKNATPEIEANWESDVALADHDTVVTSQTEHSTGIVFVAKRPVQDFKILALSLKEFGSDGKPVFLIKELYTKDTLRPERPLLAKISLIGSIPNNGFSYVDANGKTRYYSINASGEDGSVVLSEF